MFKSKFAKYGLSAIAGLSMFVLFNKKVNPTNVVVKADTQSTYVINGKKVHSSIPDINSSYWNQPRQAKLLGALTVKIQQGYKTIDNKRVSNTVGSKTISSGQTIYLQTNNNGQLLVSLTKPNGSIEHDFNNPYFELDSLQGLNADLAIPAYNMGYQQVEAGNFNQNWQKAYKNNSSDTGNGISLYHSVKQLAKVNQLEVAVNKLQDEQEYDRNNGKQFSSEDAQQLNALTKQLKSADQPAYVIKNNNQSVLVKTVPSNSHYLMIKVNNHIYYSSNLDNFSQATAVSDFNVISNFAPTKKNRQYIKVSKDNPIYAYQGEKWVSGKQTWTFNGSHWVK